MKVSKIKEVAVLVKASTVPPPVSNDFKRRNILKAVFRALKWHDPSVEDADDRNAVMTHDIQKALEVTGLRHGFSGFDTALAITALILSVISEDYGNDVLQFTTNEKRIITNYESYL